jgi:3-methyladenine DNA glycosylase AlkD
MSQHRTQSAPALAMLRRDIRAVATPARAAVNKRFFKTGKGDYGEGDLFLGVTVPAARVLVAKYQGLSLVDIEKLLHSKFHEERLLAFLILVRRFQKADTNEKLKLYAFYLEHADYANNWDLVDSSAPYIVGVWLVGPPLREKDARRLFAMFAKSKGIWRRRIAIVATLAFIRNGIFEHTFRVADMLMSDTHDLIHKAVGWMLREVGKKDTVALVSYLRTRYKKMPRTSLRYAIERFPQAQRKRYLAGTL